PGSEGITGDYGHAAQLAERGGKEELIPTSPTSCLVGTMQAEVDMIELTLDQVQALAQAGSPPTVIDPTTRKIYALVPTDVVTSSQETHEPRETPAPPWKYLVVRKHPWRKQLYIKGRNMTVRQLVGTVKASRFT